MMEFKHIEIGNPQPACPEDEEETVIVAGSVSETFDDRLSDKRGETEDLPNQAHRRNIKKEGTSSGGEVRPDHDESDARDDDRRREDAYSPTTLEDIDSSKMPTTQIVVIVVALACLAAFIIWYLVSG